MELLNHDAIYTSPTVEKDIREFFLKERKRLTLTQEEVADAAGITQSMVSRIERDAPYDPGLTVFVKAIRGLGMTPSVFFTKFERRTAPGIESDEIVVHGADGSVIGRRKVNSTPNTRAPQSGAADAAAVRSGAATHDNEIRRLRTAMFEAGKILVSAGLGGARKPDPATGARAAGRGRRHSGSTA